MSSTTENYTYYFTFNSFCDDLVMCSNIHHCFSLQDVGFSKEYEEVRADSCLDEYTAQDAQDPANMTKNRYPNIVACELHMVA